MIEKVLPAIYKKFPCWGTPQVVSQVVYIQQDNPNTHFKRDNLEWIAACTSCRNLVISMRKQPAQSPDTNVLDLGLFRALQQATWKIKRASDIDGLIKMSYAWTDYPSHLLNRVWLSYQWVCDEIITHNGDNDYDLPHINKGGFDAKGALPKQIPVSEQACTLLARYQDI